MEFLLVLTMNMFGHSLVVVPVVIIILINLDLLAMITCVVLLHICGGLSSVVRIPHGFSKCCHLHLLT